MKDSIVLDTSFLSALLAEEDVNHLAAIEKFQSIYPKYNILIPIVVLMELELLPKSLEEDSFYKVIQDFLKLIEYTVINFDETFLELYKLINQQIEMKISTIDLTILVVTIINKAELITYDKELRKFSDIYLTKN